MSSKASTTNPQRYANKPAGLPCPNSSASFWHSEPNAYLLNYQSTTSLPSEADIVIIGSGITGASVARYLAEDPRLKSLFPSSKNDKLSSDTTNTNTNTTQPSIVLLEARQICYGATGRNGGHCQPLLFDRTPEVAAFEVKNVHAVQSYIEQHSVDCEWRSVTGCRSFWRPELFEAAKKEVEKLGEVDPELRRMVDLIEAGDVEQLKRHRVGQGACGVTLTKGAGQLWPYKYVTFIIEKLVREGKLAVYTDTPVTRIESVAGTPISTTRGKDSDSSTNNDASHHYTQILHTPRGTLKARHTILATNGYTSHLLRHFTDLIVPVRCEMSALHPPKNSTRLPNSYGMVGFDRDGNPDHDDYLVQRPFYDSSGSSTLTSSSSSKSDYQASYSNGNGNQGPFGGHLMFGGGRSSAMYECLGVSDDDIVDPGEAEYLRKTLLKVLDLDGDVAEAEELGELRASHQWTGIKGYSRDNMPWVGKVPRSVASFHSPSIPSSTGATSDGEKVDADETSGGSSGFYDGLWLCAGYTGHGMPNATLCGKAVVEMLLAEEEASQQSQAQLPQNQQQQQQQLRPNTNTAKAKETLYATICSKLVASHDLPESYLITRERLDAADRLPSVAEQEAEAADASHAVVSVAPGTEKNGQSAGAGRGMSTSEKRKEASRCLAM